MTTHREARFPCSFAQQRLWFVDQYEPGSHRYNISMAWKLRGVLDKTALRFAIDALVARHETLRTRFEALDAGPIQVVEEQARGFERSGGEGADCARATAAASSRRPASAQ